MISRILSGLVVAGYVVFTCASGAGPVVLLIMPYLGFCLGCIWFSEAMGDFVGGRITSTTPDWAVAFGGWLLLLMPILVGFYLHWKQMKAGL